MRFVALERAGGAPVELYCFHQSTTVLARYTSSDVPRQVEMPSIFSATGGNLTEQYLPAAISREAVEGTDERSGTGLKVRVAIGDTETAALADLYVDGGPSTPVELSLYRTHHGSGDIRRVFFGDVTAAEFEGGMLTLNCEPKHAALQQGILRQLWQGPCNNTLYDGFCGVNKASFAVAGTVDTISTDGLTITVSEASAFADGYFAAGGLLEFGTRRGFLSAHTGASLTLFRRVPGLIAGSSVTLYPGCDRTLGICVGTFANGANHMGFPLIPTRDPFTTGVD